MELLLKSKTLIGLILFLLIFVGLVYFNQLTPTAVDFIKWLGGSFFLSRGMDNITNFNGNKE